MSRSTGDRDDKKWCCFEPIIDAISSDNINEQSTTFRASAEGVLDHVSPKIATMSYAMQCFCKLVLKPHKSFYFLFASEINLTF